MLPAIRAGGVSAITSTQRHTRGACGGKISAKAVTTVYLDLLRALKGMHDMNIIHRDIHTGNIMYNPRTERWVLIDLGLSGEATPTYRSLDLMALAMVMLSLSNMIDLDWPDLVVDSGPDRVRWIDAHPTIRFRAIHHKGRDWNRIYAVIRASMTLNPRYADINDLIAHLEDNAVKTKSDAPLQAKAAVEEVQVAADEAPAEVSDQRKASTSRRTSGKRKRKRLSSRLSGIFKRKKKGNLL